MRYFVITQDGNRYGPVELTVINGWVTEGRVIAETQLENEITHERGAAIDTPGVLVPPSSGPVYDYSRPPGPNQYERPHANYPRPGTPSNLGTSDLTTAWVFFALGFACCQVFYIPGYFAAKRAIEKGNPGGNAARIANLIMMCVYGVVIVLYLVFAVFMVSFR